MIRDFFEIFIVLKKGYDVDFVFLENIFIKVKIDCKIVFSLLFIREILLRYIFEYYIFN